MNIDKKTLAKIGGWGQLLIVIFNEVLSQNGGVLPTTRAGWMHILSSFVIAAGVHLASETSAGHPDGKSTIQPDRAASFAPKPSTRNFME